MTNVDVQNRMSDKNSDEIVRKLKIVLSKSGVRED